jgi:hypothetical protein
MTTELPADIAAAIDAFDVAAKAWGWAEDMGVGSEADEAKADRDAARAALDAAILAHLNAAEAERDEWRRRYGLSTNKALDAISDRDAALARVERLEQAAKAVLAYVDGLRFADDVEPVQCYRDLRAALTDTE